MHSPHAHALIRGIDTRPPRRMPGVAGVMTAADIKGTNRLNYMVADRPVLCEDTVRYVGDPVAVVAAETREQALAAAARRQGRLRAAARRRLARRRRWPRARPQIHAESAERLPHASRRSRATRRRRSPSRPPSSRPTSSRRSTTRRRSSPRPALAYFEGEGDDAQLVVVGPQHQHPQAPGHAAGGPRLGEHALRGGLRRAASSASRST